MRKGDRRQVNLSQCEAVQDGEGVALRGPGPKQKWVETELVETGRGNWGWEREERPLT